MYIIIHTGLFVAKIKSCIPRALWQGGQYYFRGIQEYIALDANNITLVFDSGKIVNISCNIFMYPPKGHPISYNYSIKQMFTIYKYLNK